MGVSQFVKRVLDEGLLGAVHGVSMCARGYVYDWPVASDFFFRKEIGRRRGLDRYRAHTLDSILWWLGDVASFEYADDNYGGVEADCVIDLVMESGVRGVVELSRTRALRNTTIIRGERASLEVDWAEAWLFDAESDLELHGPVHPSASRTALTSVLP